MTHDLKRVTTMASLACQTQGQVYFILGTIDVHAVHTFLIS